MAPSVYNGGKQTDDSKSIYRFSIPRAGAHYRIVQLFQKHKVAALIYSARLAVMATHGLTPFVPKNLLNQKFHQAKSCFCFQTLCAKAQILML